MRKRLVSAALAAAMALSMTACTSNPAEKETEAAAPADTEAAEEGEEKEAAADGDLITVGYAQVGAESDWRTANTESFKSTFTEENGYKLIFDDAQQKQENQIKAIRSFIQQGVDYIVVAPVVETGWETVLEEAKEAGIPVILSDRQMQLSDDSLYEAWEEEYPYPTYDTVCIVGSLFTDLVHEGLAKREDIIDISDIITGKHVGRESDDEIIIFSVGGMPVEDIAWGHEVYKNALANGIGVTLPLWDKPDMA